MDIQEGGRNTYVHKLPVRVICWGQRPCGNGITKDPTLPQSGICKCR